MLLTISALMISVSTLAAGTDMLVCDYQTYSDPKGNHAVEREFKLTFVIDKDKAVAYSVSNKGSVEVKFFPAETKLSFLEVTESGNLLITTVDKAGNSVHSRNIVVAGELAPSQFYGKCIFK